MTQIYIGRGLDETLARQVATELMKNNALEAHARDELGMSEHTEAKPIQAALTSAVTFASGAILPLLAMWFSPRPLIIWYVAACAIVFLGILGGIGAHTGGSKVSKGIIRVTFWGAIALGVTAGIGKLFGAVI